MEQGKQVTTFTPMLPWLIFPVTSKHANWGVGWTYSYVPENEDETTIAVSIKPRTRRQSALEDMIFARERWKKTQGKRHTDAFLHVENGRVVIEQEHPYAKEAD